MYISSTPSFLLARAIGENKRAQSSSPSAKIACQTKLEVTWRGEHETVRCRRHILVRTQILVECNSYTNSYDCREFSLISKPTVGSGHSQRFNGVPHVYGRLCMSTRTHTRTSTCQFKKADRHVTHARALTPFLVPTYLPCHPGRDAPLALRPGRLPANG